MGFLSGALSFRRFRVVGSLPPDFRSRAEAGIQRYAFVEKDKARTKDENFGWVSLLNPEDTHLTPDKYFFEPCLVLALRIDKKRVPPRFLKIQVDRKIAEEKAARGIPRIGAQQKKEIKALLEEDLLGRAIPIVTCFDVVWDLRSMELLLFTTSDAVTDFARTLFKQTFELDLERIYLGDPAREGTDADAWRQMLETLAPLSLRVRTL